MQTLSHFRSTLRYGFTLIELLLVIGIIAILASIVIVAINPTKQLGDARDAQRRSDVNTVLNAVYQFAIDNNGVLPSCIGTAAKGVCSSSGCTAFDTGSDAKVVVGDGIDGADDGDGCGVEGDLVPAYLVDIPMDPSGAPADSDDYTGYDIVKDANGRVTVSAPFVEQATAISVTR